MDEDKKQKVLVITMSCCLALAVVIFLMTSGIFKGKSKVDMDAPISLLCVNPDCGAGSDITRQEYADAMKNSGGGMGPMAIMAPIECPVCGEMSATKGLRCKGCGEVFLQNFNNPDDYSDRCPHCGYSATEERRGE